MPPELERLRIETAALDVTERERLGHELLDSLHDDPVDPELEQQWIAEAVRRIEAYDRGEIKAIPEDEVLAFLGFPKNR